MGYIRKNVNLLLLMLLIISLGVLAGLTTFYQTTYKNLSLSYQTNMDDLAQLNYNLTMQKAELDQLNDELKLNTQVKEKFDVLYENITDFNQKITGDLQDTKQELSQTIENLRKTEADLSSAESELENTKAALKNEIDSNNELQLQAARYTRDICDLHQRLNESC